MNDARLGGSLYLVVDLVLVVALALVSAYWTWQLIAPRVVAAPSFSATPAAADAGALARRHLFGSGGENAAVETRSGAVRLLGVASPGRALIAVGGERARAYVPGESLTAGLVLREVHADHVVVARDGVLERITLDRRVARGASQPGANVRR